MSAPLRPGELEAVLAASRARGEAASGAPSASEDEDASERLVLPLAALLAGLAVLLGPLGIGAALMFPVGELLLPLRGRNESARGRTSLASVCVVAGLTTWLPTGEQALVRVALGLAIVLFSFAPALLADATVGAGAALARSLDRAMRSPPRDLLPGATLAAFFCLTPYAVSLVWHIDEGQRPPFESFVLVGVCALVAIAAAGPACLALRVVARDVGGRRSHRAPMSPAGIVLVASLALSAAWTLGAVPVVVGGGSGAMSYPMVLTRLGDGGLVRMHRTDEREFGILVLHAPDGWSITTVDPDTVDFVTGDAEPTELADVRAAAIHLLAFAALLPLSAALAWLLWARGAWLRERLGRSHVIRARFRGAEVHDAMLPAGAELVLTEGAVRVRLDAPLDVTGLDDALARGEWVEAAIVAPRAWSPGADYRSTPRPPPRGARVVAGDLSEAIVAARLEDLERAIWATAVVAPTLVLLLALSWLAVLA